MRVFVTGLLILLVTTTCAQMSEVDRCGLDEDPRLNEFESSYFNEVFHERRGNFDFSGKFVGFFTGSAGKTKSTKSRYFSGLKRDLGETGHQWQAGGTQLLILEIEERERSGGYDAILVSWSKLLKEGKSREKLVRKLADTRPD